MSSTLTALFTYLKAHKKYLFLVGAIFLGLLLSLAFFFYPNTSTLSPSKVAENNARIISQKNNNFTLKLNFQTKNNAAKSIVHYYISLYKTDAQGKVVGFSPIDIARYKDDIVLEGSATGLEKEISYQAPAYLTGNYDLIVEYANEVGASRDSIDLGTVKLTGNNKDFLEIYPETCSLRIANEATPQKYNLMQGVDVAKNEDLILTCAVENHFSTNITASPQFVNFRRKNFYAESAVPQESKESIITVFAPGERKTISLSIPKALNPQTYDLSLVLQGESGHAISTTILTHYVVGGESATFRDIMLDKNYYSANSMAKVTVLSSGSADNFEGSRLGGTKNSVILGEIDILNSKGTSCLATKKIVDLTAANVLGTEISLPIAKDCAQPYISATIKDGNGNLLDERTFLH